MLSDESLDDDELIWMVLLKQHGLTLILAVLLIDFGGDDALDLVIAWFWLARIVILREVKVKV